MAAEIRDLEDQLYEYDHQYKLLEQELEVLRQQNMVLKAAAPPKRSLLAPLGRNDSQFEPRPQDLPNKPEPMLDAPRHQPESILEPSTRPQPVPSNQPAPIRPAPEDSNTDELPSPSRPRSTPPADLPQPTPSQPAPSTPSFPPPENKMSPNSDFDLEELLPPTIDPGVTTPPPLPPVSQRADGSPIAPEDNLEMNLARIEIPTQKVSAVLSAGDISLAGEAGDSATQLAFSSSANGPTDSRVIELAFHPALSRAINMDEHSDPDGLYLVLQPKNELGQMVPTAANLLVFALDPARQGDQAKIGRWEFTAAEVQQKLQPIGSEQGIHLRLPWTGPNPTADRVIVFVLYKFANGRQVMGEKEIFLANDGSLKTVWSPRAATGDSRTASSTTGAPVSPVSQASFQTPPSGASPRPETKLPTATIHTNPVVRPTNGSGSIQPPPLPQAR